MKIEISKSNLKNALDRLDESVYRYCEIKKKCKGSRNFKNPTFRKSFNGFYRIRRSKVWQDYYYEQLAKGAKKGNLSFDNLLKKLHKQTGKIEASYCSKLIATIDPSKPVIDKYVLKNIGAKLPHSKSKNRMEKICGLYEEMCMKYSEFLKTDFGKQSVKEFNERFNKCKVHDTKILDFILWKMR